MTRAILTHVYEYGVNELGEWWGGNTIGDEHQNWRGNIKKPQSWSDHPNHLLGHCRMPVATKNSSQTPLVIETPSAGRDRRVQKTKFTLTWCLVWLKKCTNIESIFKSQQIPPLSSLAFLENKVVLQCGCSF